MNQKLFRGLPVLLFVLLLAGGCQKKEEKPVAAPPTVAVAPAVEEPIREGTMLIGEVSADQSVDLVARVKGFLIERNFKEGAGVKKDDVLFKIEPTQYEAALDNAKASLLKAQAALKNAEIELNRQKTLLAKDASSQREYDNALAAQMEAKAQVLSAESEVKQAELDLSYTTIRAPFDGWIGLSTSDVGNLVGPETGRLATVRNFGVVRVSFNASELDLLKLLRNRDKKAESDLIRCRLYLADGSEYDEVGKLTYWDNNVNTTTGTIKLQALFENAGKLLVDGMYVKVRLELADPVQHVVIPLQAVQEDQQGKFVYVVTPANKVERRNIRVGESFGDKIVVYEGVSVGENVIVQGIQKVRNGIEVKVAAPVVPVASEETPETASQSEQKAEDAAK